MFHVEQTNFTPHPLKSFPDSIAKFIELLKTYNETTNIYSQSAYDKLDFHITDCITLASLIGSPNFILDMGSGSGLPSVILAIILSKSKVVAVESKGRKCDFLRLAKTELGLSNFTVIQEDINQYIHTAKPRPDIITAKAFAPYPKAIMIASKMAKKGCQLWIPISAAQRDAITTAPTSGIDITTHSDGYLYLKKQF
jgi:16S rRNA (guanine527-N7)-methyltransferase